MERMMASKKIRGEAASRAEKTVKPVTNVKPAVRTNSTSSVQGFPIVGVGASAGGLTAFEEFFSGMPADAEPGMAFVLVQHLAPDHKSILSELIRRYTRMAVYEVEDGIEVKPNCAYIIPPNRDMALLNGSLHLLEQTKVRGQRLPIDFFFRSLAQDQHERAICIVLSGSGSDGSLGVREVKGEGGMVMAQTPESTEYDSMPRSAIATGMVDYVLPPVAMPVRLIAYAGHVLSPKGLPAVVLPDNHDDALKKVCILLRSETGHDFSQYKRNTISRRIERRMAIHQIDKLLSYVRYIQQTPAELQALFRDLLIGVTSFFRDPDTFALVEKQAIPRLFEGKSAGSTIRVWIPGCSTGEEAYSLAILLMEQMQALKKQFHLQVFATDIDSKSIEQARSGIYPVSIAADLTPERLKRFFTLSPEGSSYRILKGLREIMIFSEQDLIKDPPFSRIDLISCRNLLIYLNADLQKRLIRQFHYSLNSGGMLFLGTSESIGDAVDLFFSLERQSKLYLRKDDPYALNATETGWVPLRKTEELLSPLPLSRLPVDKKQLLRELNDRTLLEHIAAFSVLVNERGDIFYIQGRSGPYLELSAGVSNLNILPMAREGLQRDLTIALHKAVAQNKPVLQPGVRVKTNGGFSRVNLTVRPVVHDPASVVEQRLFLVILEELPAAEPVSTAEAVPGSGAEAGADLRLVALRHELQAKEEYLQTTIEELQTSNEELMSTNEEMQSVNEELQATNEELETSKEELQSVNEELATVNSELQTKVSDLSQTTNDMSNLLSGTGIATLFVDLKLHVKRFTPAVSSIISLIPSDVGRPVGQIVTKLVGYTGLLAEIKEVLDTLVPIEREVQAESGAWYMMRIRPYRTLENVIEGGVLSFFDITEIVTAREMLKQANSLIRLAVVTRDAHDAIIMQDLDGRILAWNPSAERMYGYCEAESLAMNIRDIIPAELRDDEFAIQRQFARGELIQPYQSMRIAKDGTLVEVFMTATALHDEEGVLYGVSTTERACREEGNRCLKQRK